LQKYGEYMSIWNYFNDRWLGDVSTWWGKTLLEILSSIEHDWGFSTLL
jgi:hypothetical protein